MTKSIEVDTRTFVRFWLVILGFVLAGLFIRQAAVALIIIGVAAFIAIALQPLADKINRLTKKDHGTSSAILAFAVIVILLGIIISTVGPLVINQTTVFIQKLPETFQHTLGGWDGINNIGQTFGIENLRGEILSGIQSFSSSITANFGNLVVSGVSTIASAITNIILTLVLSLLFILEGPEIVNSFWKIVSKYTNKLRAEAWRRLGERIVDVIKTYISKQVLVAILDGMMSGLFVFILSIFFGFSGGIAVPIGLIAMVLYLIPMFGPIISCVLNTLLIFANSPIAAIAFLVLYIVYGQIENNFIAPKLQGNALDLPASLILVAITIGMSMWGLIGAIVAIPLAGCIKVIVEELPNLRSKES